MSLDGKSDQAGTGAVYTVQSFYTALGNGDVPGVLGLLDDQVRWTEAESFPYYSGTWIGPEAVFSNLLRRLIADWDPFRARADDFLVEGNQVVSFGQYSGTFKKTGKSMTSAFAHRWTVSGGKITSFLMYADTAKVLEAMK